MLSVNEVPVSNLNIYKVVAREMGYQTDEIEVAFQRRNFYSATELVDYLYDMDYDTEDLNKLCDEFERQAFIKTELYRETEHLMSLRMCLACHNSPRSVVSVPCSHLTLCESCTFSISKCQKVN